MKKFCYLLLAVFFLMAGTVGCNADVDLEEEDDGSIILSDPEVGILNVHCGYMEGEFLLSNYDKLLIETEDQLAYAEERYGLGYPEPESEYYNFNRNPHTSIIDSFNELKQSYPFTDYVYLVQYWHYTGEDKENSDCIVIKEDRIYISKKEDKKKKKSKKSSGLDSGPNVESGTMYMSAIPREYAEGITFSNVIYPDRNDLRQAPGFDYTVEYDFAGAELMDIYGSEPIYIDNRTEFNEFIAKSSDVEFGERKSLKHWSDYLQKRSSLNSFQYCGVYFIFFTREGDDKMLVNDFQLKDGVLDVDYSFESPGPSHYRDATTCVIIFRVPKKYIYGADYEFNDNDIIADNYFAVFHGGENDKNEMYVYIEDKTWFYQTICISAYEQKDGSIERYVKDEYDELYNMWDVVWAAKQCEANSYATLPDDPKHYTLDEFRDMYVENEPNYIAYMEYLKENGEGDIEQSTENEETTEMEE